MKTPKTPKVVKTVKKAFTGRQVPVSGSTAKPRNQHENPPRGINAPGSSQKVRVGKSSQSHK